MPCLNVINGGVHAGNELAFQEFMIMPVGASSFKEAMMMATETYAQLKTLIKAKYGLGAANVGDEGGFAPPLNSADQALDLLTSAIEVMALKDRPLGICMLPVNSKYRNLLHSLWDAHPCATMPLTRSMFGRVLSNRSWSLLIICGQLPRDHTQAD